MAAGAEAEAFPVSREGEGREYSRLLDPREATAWAIF
jgi:hypothetical protein